MYSSINIDGPLKKIGEEKDELGLNDKDLKEISALLSKVRDTKFYHTSKFTDNDKMILSKLANFSGKAYVLDIFRMIPIHPSSSEIFKSDLLMLLVTICNEGFDTSVENIKILCMRIMSNLFGVDSAKPYLVSKREEIIDKIQSSIDSTNKLIKGGLAGLVYNFTILFYDKKDSEASSQLLSLIQECIATDNDIQNLIKLYTAIGNMIHKSNENLLLAKELQILITIKEKNVVTNDAIYLELVEFLNASLK